MGNFTWWQEAVFYQIYPRSFADGNGDGIGDFAGMSAKLDYLQALGITAVWLSPHYPSPFLDCGYDIADYTAVGPEYGTLRDFTSFLQGAHARGIRVILDLVLNHTSDQHPWFQASRASHDAAQRDWYIWRDGKGDGPPNNWVSIFGGSAWEYDDATGQYYYHAFLREQPDLNWRNPEVKRAMWEAVRFWLDLGVDGFRLDAIAMLFEHPDLPDHTVRRAPDEILRAMALDQGDADPEQRFADYRELFRYQIHQPGVHELLRDLRALIDTYPGDRVLVGEDEDVTYHGSGNDELHLVFNFPLMRATRLTPAIIRANQQMRLAALPPDAWPCNTLGNHDVPRMLSRYGDGSHDDALARLHLALLLTLKGTPFLYNGEEIGMTNLVLTDLRDFRDTNALRHYQMLTRDLAMPAADALRAVSATTRDRCRSPMQWSAGPNGGFSPADVTTWLPVNPNAATGVNVASQEGEPTSLLNFYRRLIHLRQTTPALMRGDYQALDAQHPDVFAFVRQDAQTAHRCLVALNFSAAPQSMALAMDNATLQLLFVSDAHATAPASDHLTLAPFGVFIAEIAGG